MIEVRWQPSNDVEVTLVQADTYTSAHLQRQAEGARLAVIHQMPVALTMWEQVTTADATEWVYVNTLTVTILFEMSEADEHDDRYDDIVEGATRLDA